jgi:hypothetical protein
LLTLAEGYRALKKSAEAIRIARELAARAGGNPTELYNVARAMSLTVPLTEGDRQQALAAEGVAVLRQAIAAGLNDAWHTSRDPDLAPLRDRGAFRRLLPKMFDRGFPVDPFARSA